MNDRTKHLRAVKPQRRVTARRSAEPERPSDEEIARAILDLKQDLDEARRAYNKTAKILSALMVKFHEGQEVVLSDADGRASNDFAVACEVKDDGMHVWVVTLSEGRRLVEGGAGTLQ